MKKRTIKGFTMLETVVCLAVFSVTLAAAVPAFEEFSEKADENNFKSQCKNILATAEVMADENYKLGTDRDALIDELNKEFSGYTIDAGFEKGKVLWLEVARKENPRMMYYTDEDSFVESKPSGFDVKRSEKTVEWAVEPTPRPVPENPVHINPFEYPAGRIGQETPAPDVDETEPVTEPEVTSVSEEAVTVPDSTTTVTTVTEPAAASSSASTVETRASEAVSESTTENENQNTEETTVVTTEYVPVTKKTEADLPYQARMMPSADFPSDSMFNSSDSYAVKVVPKDGQKIEYDNAISLDDNGYDWKTLCGVGVKYSDVNEQNSGASVQFSGHNPVQSGKLSSDYWEAEINQNGSMWDTPDKLTFFNYSGENIGEVEYYILFYAKEKEIEVSGTELTIGHDYNYYYDTNKRIKSVTMVFDDYTYNRQGNIYFNNKDGICGGQWFSMNRTNDKVITVNVENVNNQGDRIHVDISNGNGSITALYVTYE